MDFQFSKIFSCKKSSVPTLIADYLRTISKNQGKGNSWQKLILAAFFLICLKWVTGCAVLSSSHSYFPKDRQEKRPAVSYLLKDIQVVEKRDSLDILLIGTDQMVYYVFRTIDPLELVVDLPDAVVETDCCNLSAENQLLGKITILNLATESRFMIRVKIGLNQEILYRVIQDSNQIRLQLEKPSSPSTSEQPMVETKTPSSGTGVIRESWISRSSAKEYTSSLSTDEKKPLCSASKIADLDLVIMSEELRFYILADGSVTNFKVFHLVDPPRVVVDLMDIQSVETQNVWRIDGPLVRKVRIGLRENNVRIVFRLVPEAGLPYKVFPENKALQISFSPGPGFASQ